MRIAYLCSDRGIALGGFKGASVHMAEIVSALARTGAEVLLLPRSVADRRELLPPGVTVETLPSAAADPRLADWLEARLRAFAAEALYERFALHSAAGATAAFRLRIPHVVELNSPLPIEAARYRTLARPREARRLERTVLARADLVLAVSGPLAAYARAARGATRVEVFPNAVDVGRFAVPSRATDPRCVFLGALRPWHGIDTIVEAWRLLGREAPPLLVVGDGAERAALEAVGAEVTGAVPHPQVPALLSRAAIGLAPYAADAPGYFSPLKLFEYLASGLAVVAAAIPGVREVVGPEHAVLVPPGDPETLAAAVSELAADESRRLRLGAAGRGLVVARHTWDARARRIVDVLAELRLAVAS
jgi:glycosyltransferase involved in cell wall biosynthesis